MAPMSIPGKHQAPATRRRSVIAAVAVTVCLVLSACLSRTDSMAPLIAITDPRSGTTRSTDDLRISGYAMDDSGVASIRVDGSDLLADPLYSSERGKGLVNFAFTKPNVADGQLTLVLEVTDVNGRTTTERYVLTLDATPPSIELTTVESAGSGRLRVEGVASDNIALSSVRINDVPLAFSPGAEFSFSVVVNAVENGAIVVEDSAGNRVSQALQ